MQFFIEQLEVPHEEAHRFLEVWPDWWVEVEDSALTIRRPFTVGERVAVEGLPGTIKRVSGERAWVDFDCTAPGFLEGCAFLELVRV